MKIVQITAATEYRHVPNGGLEAYEDGDMYHYER